MPLTEKEIVDLNEEVIATIEDAVKKFEKKYVEKGITVPYYLTGFVETMPSRLSSGASKDPLYSEVTMPAFEMFHEVSPAQAAILLAGRATARDMTGALIRAGMGLPFDGIDDEEEKD